MYVLMCKCTVALVVVAHSLSLARTLGEIWSIRASVLPFEFKTKVFKSDLRDLLILMIYYD